MVNPPCFLKEVQKSHVGMIIPNRLRKAENVKSKKQSKAPPRIGGELCDSLMIPNSSPNQGPHRNMKASSAFKSLFALTRIVDVEPVFCAISIKKPVFHSPCKRGCFEDFWQKKLPININHSPEVYPLYVHNRLKWIAQKQLSVTAEFSTASRKGSMYTWGCHLKPSKFQFRL